MKFITWVRPNQCINFNAWLEWKAVGTVETFHRFLGFEWRTK